MNEEEFLERLREDARGLQYRAGAGALERIRRGVGARIERRETLAGILAAWFRPVAAGLAAAALVSASAFGWMQRLSSDNLLANSDVAQISEDYYRVAE